MYYKIKDGDFILGIGETDGKIEKPNVEIKKEEFYNILEIIGTRKKDQRLMEKDGKIYYVEVPGYDPIPEEDKGGLTPDEAWKIIESSNISKENKALLKDYIYKEAK